MFTTQYPKFYSDIGTKIILKLNSFCLQNNVMLKNGEDVGDGAYFVNFLSDFELLDLGSAFNHCLSLGTWALIKQDVKHFMLNGSIQFSIPFQFNTNHAFIKIMPLYNVYV